MSKLIEKEGKFYKECRVVILRMPMNNKSWSYIFQDNTSLRFNSKNKTRYNDRQGWYPQHIYITSSDEIKDGDWCLFFWDGGQIGSDKPQQYQIVKGHVLNKGLRKIIATTDTSLKLPIPEGLAEYPMSYTPKSLPQPSDKFIESYIDAHNKVGQIEKVLVEYELFDEYGNIIMGDVQRESDTVRLKLKNDNIVIKKTKDSWSRDEVCNLLNEYRVYTWKNGSTANDLIKWIEENL